MKSVRMAGVTRRGPRRSGLKIQPMKLVALRAGRSSCAIAVADEAVFPFRGLPGEKGSCEGPIVRSERRARRAARLSRSGSPFLRSLLDATRLTQELVLERRDRIQGLFGALLAGDRLVELFLLLGQEREEFRNVPNVLCQR